MNKKYKFTGNTKVYEGITLHQIQALRSFGKVKKGYLGGWIYHEKNLSHEGDCWVADNAIVTENAEVRGNAIVSKNAVVNHFAQVYGNAQVTENSLVQSYAQVYGNAQIFGHARVCAYAKVYDNALVSQYVNISGYSKVYGNAIILGFVRTNHDTEIFGMAYIHQREVFEGNSKIGSSKDVLFIAGLGEGRGITLTKSNRTVQVGCFTGTLEEFEQSIIEKYGTEGSDYHLFLPVIKAWFDYTDSTDTSSETTIISV